MIMQIIREMQGTKDTEAEWCKLLSLDLIKDMKIVLATDNKGLFTYIGGDKTIFVALATDDILLAILFFSFFTTK